MKKSRRLARPSPAVTRREAPKAPPRPAEPASRPPGIDSEASPASARPSLPGLQRKGASVGTARGALTLQRKNDDRGPQGIDSEALPAPDRPSLPALQRKGPSVGPALGALVLQRKNGHGDDSEEELSFSALIAAQNAKAGGDTAKDDEPSASDEDNSLLLYSGRDLDAEADAQEKPFRDRFKESPEPAVDAAWKAARALIVKGQPFDLERDGPGLIAQAEKRLQALGVLAEKFRADDELAYQIEWPFRAQFSEEPKQVVDVAVELAKRLVRTEKKLFDIKTRGPGIIEQARHQLKAGVGVAMLKDKLIWQQDDDYGGRTEFGRWLMDDYVEPGASSAMTCYEAVLFGAYKAGATTKKGLQKLYQTLDKNPTVPLEKFLAAGPIEVYHRELPESPRPVRGDIVVFDTAENHTALAVGNRQGPVEVLSLYNRPNGKLNLQKTTVEELLDAGTKGQVRFFAPRFP